VLRPLFSHPTSVEWRQTRGVWTALVVYLDDQSSIEGRTVLRWVRAEHLRPAVSDPNAMGWRRRMWR
jgi:hypothetical protein